MIITNDFVLLNFPKTGSTYARNRIKEIYEKKDSYSKLLRKLGLNKNYCIDLILPIYRTLSAQKAKRHTPHGAYYQIPTEHNDKPVYAVIRNPFDLYVSQFEFKEWGKNAEYIFDVDKMKRQYPHWPEIHFKEFVEIASTELVNDLLCNKASMAKIGRQSLNFIKFFAKDPDEIIDKLTDEYLDSEDILLEFNHINFLQNESLNDDLLHMLLGMGYKSNDLKELRKDIRDNVSDSRKQQTWEEYYDAALKQKVRYLERLLFRLFPEYDK